MTPELDKITRIVDPLHRFFYVTKFLKRLERTKEVAREIRDLSLVELRAKHGDTYSDRFLADQLGVSKQYINRLIREAQKRYYEDAS